MYPPLPRGLMLMCFYDLPRTNKNVFQQKWVISLKCKQINSEINHLQSQSKFIFKIFGSGVLSGKMLLVRINENN